MQKTSNRSLGDLKRETEQTRASLTETVEQLRTSVSDTASDIRQRLSPQSIKAEVSGYVRSRGERLAEDVTAAARRNPMQAVAVGAAIAYPLMRLARTIPMPVMMIGAGLFFAGSKTGQSALHKAAGVASDVSDEVRRRGHDLSDQVGASVATARDAATEAVGRAGEMMLTASESLGKSANTAGAAIDAQTDAVRDKAISVADTVTARGRDLAGNVVDLAGVANKRIRDFASETASAAQNSMASTQESALQTAKELRNKASTASDRVGKTAFETIEQNPLLVAGVGLLLGGLIASALPRSDLEDNLVGEASEATKNKALDATSRGFDAAKDAAGEIFERVARQAGAEGLTADGLETAAKDIGQRVRHVAEAAVSTAFDPEKSTL